MRGPDIAATSGRSASSRWIGAGIGVVFVSIQILIERLDTTGITIWSFGALAGIAGAAFLFRSKRARPWYWPALAAMAGAQIALILWQASALPTQPGKALAALALWDGGFTCLFLLWMAWLFDPHKNPRTRASTTVEIMIYAMVSIFIALACFVSWGISRSAANDPRIWTIVLTRQSTVPMNDLLQCFSPKTGGPPQWADVAGQVGVKRTHDFGRGVTTIIADRESRRVIQFATVAGHTLSARERADIDRCLLPHDEAADSGGSAGRDRRDERGRE